MAFEIQTNQTPGEISFNYEELNAYIDEQITMYKNMVVTEETIKDGKEVVAQFNKMAKDLNKRRIEAQKIWMNPFDAFKGHIDEAIKKLEAGGSEIKKQLDAFEQDRIKKRHEELKKIYESNIGKYAPFLPYEQLFKPQWLNKGTKDSDVVYAISEAMAKVETDLTAIKAIGSEIEEKLINVYKANGNNLSAAITEDSRYREAKKQAEENLRAEQERKAREEAERAEQKAREEAERAIREAEQKAREEAEKQWFEASKSEIEAIPVREPEKESLNDDFINEPEMIFKVVGADAIDQIQNFLELSEIKYEVM